MLFISYSTKGEGKTYAGELKSELEEAFFPCFLAHEDIQESEDWVRSILTELRTCSAFLGVLDSGFNKSSYCQQELGAALGLEKPLLLVSRDGKTHPQCLAEWIQSARAGRVLTALNKQPRFKPLRVAAYVRGVREIESFARADSLERAFGGEWETMTLNDKLRWLGFAARNGQVYNARYGIGLAFKRRCAELRNHLTREWLKEHDSDHSIRAVIRRQAKKR